MNRTVPSASSLVKPFVAGLKHLTNNHCGVSLSLEAVVTLAQYLQGIGSGSDASHSGEGGVFRKLLRETRGSNRELCIFDVGANEGQWLALARSCLGDRRFNIHSFEPGETTYQLLLENAGHRKDAVLNNCGLGREPERA